MNTNALNTITVSNPSWDNARKLLNQVRQSIHDWIALGEEISALKERFSAQGAGGGNFSRTSAAGGRSSEGCENRTSPGAGRSSEKGWQETVERELGISNQTAYRLIEKAEYLKKIKVLAESKPVRYIDCAGFEKTIEPTEGVVQIAQRSMESIASGELSAKRAFVGLVGESSRRRVSGKTGRAPADYGKLSHSSAVTFCNALKHWPEFDGATRKHLADVFPAVVAAIPDELRSHVVSGIHQWSIPAREAIIAELRRELEHDKKQKHSARG